MVFFDDILVYSSTYAEHLIHIQQVLELLLKDQWKVKFSMCSFAKRELHYLGHVISGKATDPRKVESIINWPTPISVKELKSFLGLASYYRRFVKDFSVICKPLTDLLKKSYVFLWTSVHSEAFDLLKQALSSTPVLALPDFSKPFCIETDACGTGIGVVLMKEGHPLAYISKPLSGCSFPAP